MYGSTLTYATAFICITLFWKCKKCASCFLTYTLYFTIYKATGIEAKGLHSLRHTFATNLVNGIKQEDGSIKSLAPRQIADFLGHSTSQITEMYYVKKDTSYLSGITDGFEI